MKVSAIKGFSYNQATQCPFLGRDIRDILKEKLKENLNTDSFIPSSNAPSQPIIIDKIIIEQSESAEKKSNLKDKAKNAICGGATAGTGFVANDIIKGQKEDNSAEISSQDEQNQDLEDTPISDKSVAENDEKISDDSETEEEINCENDEDAVFDETEDLC